MYTDVLEMCYSLLTQASSQATNVSSDSDDESHASPQEDPDDSLVEASGPKPVSRSRSGSSQRSTSSKGSKRSKVQGSKSKSKGVVGLLETIYTETTSAQKDMMKKVNF